MPTPHRIPLAPMTFMLIKIFETLNGAIREEVLKKGAANL